jgi:two-component SAPR family response regulator
VNTPHDDDADHFREAPVPDVLPPLRILVVEDEGLIALNLELMLRRFGCEIVGPVSEVDDVVGTARAHKPDGAFLDVNLRGRKVFDVLPQMMGLGVPCVLSSGYDDPMHFPAAFRDLPRIAKPFDEKALRRACAAFGALASARRLAEARQAEVKQAEVKQAEMKQAEARQAEARQAADLAGEHCAVPFPRRRRLPLPAAPLTPDSIPPSRATAIRRGR